jgi:hypothetical protein
MRDTTHQELADRVDLARDLCVHSLRNVLAREYDIDPELRQDAMRSMKQLGMARRNLRRYELSMRVQA